MSTLSRAKAAVRRAHEEMAKAQLSLREVRQRRRILCSCGRTHAIGKLELIITHWYVEPYSCSAGDYWKEGEWQFACPKTGVRNRFMFDDWGVKYGDRDKVDVAAEPTFKSIYRGLFGSQKSVHERDSEKNYASYNNYFVDRHRARFELPEQPAIQGGD